MGARNISEKLFTVYAHISPDGQAYVGMTSQPLNKRWGLNGGGYRNQNFYSAIQDIGWDNFDHIVLNENLTMEQAAIKEKEYIDKFDSYRNGYNSSLGGENIIPYHKTDETRALISRKRKGKCCGEDNPMYGKSVRDRFSSEEEYLSWRNHFEKNRLAGIKKKKKRVICVNNGEIFESSEAAAKKYGIKNSASVRLACLKNVSMSTYVDESGRYLQFDYYEDGKTYNMQDYILKRSKAPVICFPSKDVYCTIQEASNCLNISYDRIRSLCKKTVVAHGIDFMYYADYIQNGYVKKEYARRSVICLDTLEVFSSISKAGKETGCTPARISECCKGLNNGTNSLDGKTFMWQYYDEYLSSPKDVRQKKVHHYERKTICLTTHQIFNTSAEADRFYGLARGSANNCCRGVRKYSVCKKTGERLEFAYCD